MGLTVATDDEVSHGNHVMLYDGTGNSNSIVMATTTATDNGKH